MKNNRKDNIKSKITAFSKEAYKNEDVLDELFKFQQEVVNLTFEETHAERMNLRMYDVYNYLSNKNVELGGAADDELLKFKDYCDEFRTMIGREVAGTSGERKVFRTLETLNSENRVLNNVELKSDTNRAEIDEIVITPKGIFLLEVKNSNHDMIIDTRGNYYRARGYMTFDYNIAEKINVKEHLLRKVIKESDLPEELKKANIIKFVVFANSKMHCDNRYKHLKVCYLSNLPQTIDEHVGKDIYSLEDMSLLEEIIRTAEKKEEYPVDFDFEGFKECFSNIMVCLEQTAEIEKESLEDDRYEEIWIPEEKVTSRSLRCLAGAAVSVVAVSLTGMAYKLSR